MSGLVIFSKNVDRLAAFYEAVIGARPNPEESGDVRLLNGRDEVLVHSIPARIADKIVMSDPVVARANSPLKPIFEVDSIGAAIEAVLANGGATTATAFSIGGIDRRDVIDPDGNVIQLRSSAT
jgi:predicted enzyme related to lactoylglutathione lyase